MRLSKTEGLSFVGGVNTHLEETEVFRAVHPARGQAGGRGMQKDISATR